ncbi:MAG TPA: 7-cyano-7-deazaguanine synthase QueC [Leptospiraceae bacterium]|jgi:7-cyano-7-deazaguanine synthase|nr:7-cyano-7-deazaguanine synthase QueC [Leptospirales bacterium]HMU81794.1 7-cyano-7-deazaguanine synthase QueC [Leptospiraceae bacterium]HMW58736.1 7-cyano-7-deazaguanine synthase QueC [Leptospiraceae bacterium]HMX55369.1 7-cyano-7-deazaguanine synthase QueC [Leptospiraceae bacterium]HNE21731.1 7-cyano-7-deazaguanine synthase QueC [Leptospiraceae bacterium]
MQDVSTKAEGAVVLLSGGLDSATVLQIAKSHGYSLIALSFDYGQRHKFELERARELAIRANAKHLVLRIDQELFKNTALVPGGPAVPEKRQIDDSIPVTYVPARNILFLSHALAVCESNDIGNIFIGVNALDYSGYPDCRPEFIQAFEQMAALGMKRGVEGRPIIIHAPLMQWNKARIIQEGMKLGVDYSRTSSCYQPSASGKPCGLCDSCVLREKGFAEAGLIDPLKS